MLICLSININFIFLKTDLKLESATFSTNLYVSNQSSRISSSYQSYYQTKILLPNISVANTIYNVWPQMDTSGARGPIISSEPVPAYTLSQLRSLVTPTIPVSNILLVELGREGLFRYESTSTLADDGAIMVVTSNGKHYKRVLSDNRITPQMFGAIPDDGNDDGASLLAWINYTGSYEHYLPAGVFLSSVALTRIDKKGFTLKGAGQGKSFIQFIGDTHGIRVANVLGKGAYGQITMSDFEITSTGTKSAGKEALYINSEHEQRPGPALNNLMIRSTGVSTNQWTVGLRYHNTSRTNTYGLSISGIDYSVMTGLAFTTDSNRSSVEHNVTNFNFQSLKKGVAIDAPPTGTRTIEGIQFTDGSIVGAVQGVVGITAIRNRSPYLGFSNVHINTFGGEAIYLDGYIQLVFSKCLFYSNTSTAGIIPPRSVYISNSVFCKGDFDLHLIGNLPAGAEFKGIGGGLDMRINGSHSYAKTYFVKQDATFPGKLDVERIWTGTTGGPPVDKLAVVGGRGWAPITSSAEKPVEGSVLRYDNLAGNYVYRPVLPHVANVSKAIHITTSAAIDVSLYDVVSVENGNSPVTITIDNTKILEGQKIWVKRYNEFSKGIITVQSIAPKYNLFQDLDGGYKQSIILPNGVRPLAWYYNGSIFEMISGGSTLNPANNLNDLIDKSASRNNLGLGTVASQNANDIAITGGIVNGLTSLSLAGDLTLASANRRMINFTGFASGQTIGLSLDTYLKFTATFGRPWTLLSFHGLKVDNVSGTTNPTLQLTNNSSSAPILTAYNSTTTNVARIEDDGLLKYVHSSGSLSGPPSVSVGPGAGSTAIASIRSGGNDEAHQVTVTTGTAPKIGTLLTVTFAKTYSKPPIVVFSAASGVVPPGVTILVDANSVNTYVMYANGTLTANTTYKWNVHVRE
ncbi:hypothetical protein GCM10028774_30650 [Spirosoma jeollabukense]